MKMVSVDHRPVVCNTKAALSLFQDNKGSVWQCEDNCASPMFQSFLALIKAFHHPVPTSVYSPLLALVETDPSQIKIRE